jgi:hypothetical protein
LRCQSELPVALKNIQKIIAVEAKVNNYQRPRLTHVRLRTTMKWNKFSHQQRIKRSTRCFKAAAITSPLTITEQITGWILLKLH